MPHSESGPDLPPRQRVQDAEAEARVQLIECLAQLVVREHRRFQRQQTPTVDSPSHPTEEQRAHRPLRQL